MRGNGFAVVRALLLSAMLIGIAAFAAQSLGASRTLFAPDKAAAALDPGDDPVRARQLLDTRLPATPRQAAAAAEPSAVLLLDEWNFTAKKKPSPYH